MIPFQVVFSLLSRLVRHCVASSLLVLVAAVGARGEVVMQGFVPPGMSAAFVQYEYERIWQVLAPHKPVDPTPVTVCYFTKKATDGEAYALPEWGGGGAIGSNRIVVAMDAVPAMELDLAQITVHELAHVVLNRICGKTRIPRWFHEGIAMTLSCDAGLQEQFAVSRAILTGGLLPLASIDSVNTFGRARAQLAYGQSRGAYLFLVETYGMESVTEIIAAAADQGSFATGVEAALGLSLQELNRLANAYVSKRYGGFLWLADTHVFWVCLSILFVAGFLVTKARRRKQKRAMEDETPQQAGQAAAVETDKATEQVVQEPRTR